MSKLEVDAIEPQSGTTITIGSSGDTVNLIGTLNSNGSPLPGDISEVVAGTGLSGGGQTGAVTLNIEAAQPTITSLGTITTFRSTGIDDNADALAMTIDSSENVGIGTASPGAKLDIYNGGINVDTTGNALLATRYTSGSGSTNINLYKSQSATIGTHTALSNGSGIGAIITRASDGTSFINATAISSEVDNAISTNSVPSRLTFSTNSGSTAYSERMRITSAGNVGINNSAPTTPLEVNGVVRVNEAPGVSNQGSIIIDALATGNPNLAFQQAGTYKGYIHYLDSSNTICLNDGSGNGLHYSPTLKRLGIDTSAPQYPLEVNGVGLFNGAIITNGGTDSADRRGSITHDGSSMLIKASGNSTNRNIIFEKSGDGSADETMRIDTNSNILIGATTLFDGAKVFVAGAKALSGGIPQQGINVADTTAIATGVGGAIMFSGKYSGDNITCFGSIEGSKENGTSGQYGGELVFKTRQHGGNNFERMRITSTGQVAINTTSPDSSSITTIDHPGSSKYALTANSTETSGTQYHISFSRGGTQAGYITSNSATTIAVNNASDERLKENIENSGSAIQNIKDLKVRQFDWKDNIDTHKDFGFVAQELVNVIPEAVTQGTDELDDNGKPVRSWE